MKKFKRGNYIKWYRPFSYSERSEYKIFKITRVINERVYFKDISGIEPLKKPDWFHAKSQTALEDIKKISKNKAMVELL
jgi:hypothetical protein